MTNKPRTHVEMVSGTEMALPVEEYHDVQAAMLSGKMQYYVGTDLFGANFTLRVSDISLVVEVTNEVLEMHSEQPEWLKG